MGSGSSGVPSTPLSFLKYGEQYSRQYFSGGPSTQRTESSTDVRSTILTSIVYTLLSFSLSSSSIIYRFPSQSSVTVSRRFVSLLFLLSQGFFLKYLVRLEFDWGTNQCQSLGFFFSYSLFFFVITPMSAVTLTRPRRIGERPGPSPT